MKTIIKAALSAATLLAGISYATAQDTIIITPEQRTVVREYVVREKIDPITGGTYEVAVGSVLPPEVELRKLAIDDFGNQYEFVVTDRGTLVVDPATRRIVDIVN